MNHLIVETEDKDTFVSWHELAATNDIESFKRSIECDSSAIDETGLWYGRQRGSKQMVREHRTPLMVAATYGSIDVLKLILSLSIVDVNRSCGLDKSTALHCVASGGSVNAAEIVKLLLVAGADPNLVDANGYRPVDVIVVSPKLLDSKFALEKLLATDSSISECNQRVSSATSNSNSPPLSPSPNRSPPSASDSTSSPNCFKFNGLPACSASEKKEYPIDASLSDINNCIYSTDEFRMFSLKVRPCSRAYSHDWTECPFVHPGENARRRDPRKYHYSCVPCPDFRKGACRHGDVCEYAHGVFECWLHPAQYRTRICKDGMDCNRRVCFFAHAPEELRRPLYPSTGSAIPSPRSNGVDFAVGMSLLPSSPSSVSVMSPSPFTPPMSPSAKGISNMGWPQPNVPTLHLPGSNLQFSRLRSSLNVRDISADDINLLPDSDVQQQQFLNELSGLSQQSVNTNSLNRSVPSKHLTPSNLEDLFSTESSSHMYSDPALTSAVLSPTHRSALFNQFQQQRSMSSPINTNFSARNVEYPLLHASYGVPSSGRLSPRSVEPISPMNSRASMFAQCKKQQQQFRSLSSCDLGSNSADIIGSPVEPWPKWGSSNRKPDCAINADEYGEEPDVSWVQSLVKESPLEIEEKSPIAVSGVSGATASSGEGSN